MLSLLFCLVCNVYYFPQDFSEPSLDIKQIPDSLLIDANAVIRYENTTCEIVNLGKKVLTKEKAVTVLNQEGDWAGAVSIYYRDKADKVKDLKVEIYNSNGERIKKIKKKEINDLSVYDGFSVAGDGRQKYYSYTSNQYPYTVKYSYTEDSKNTLHIPAWFPMPGMNVSVQKNRYEITTNIQDYEILHKTKNLQSSQLNANTSDHVYVATDLAAMCFEARAPHYTEYFPMIRFSPTKFNYYGIEGAYTNWKMYGKWMYENMLEGRDDLPEELIQNLDQIIPEGSTKDEVARIIYNYVTESTRYVSVQLGLGGYRPFTSSDVHELKYGDCKALSFYTANILKHYDIEAIYTEIMSERAYSIGYEEDLPSPSQGNHIVLCLPNEGDTTWLECTSKSTFFGYAHSGIDNRRALMITADGGKLITTTKYSSSENLAKKKAKIKLDKENVTMVNFENRYFNQRHEPWSTLLHTKDAKRNEMLRDQFFDYLPQYELLNYDIKVNEKKRFLHEEAELSVKNLVEKAGEYIIIPYMVEYIYKPKALNLNREQKIYIKNGRKDEIEIEITIPDGYGVVENDKNLDFKNSFGAINVAKEQKNDNLYKISINIEYYDGTFEPQMVLLYNQFAESLNEIINDKLILKPI